MILLNKGKNKFYCIECGTRIDGESYCSIGLCNHCKNHFYPRHKRNYERFSVEYQTWHYEVLFRDSFTCQKCGIKSPNRLEVHHIKSWAGYPKLRYKTNNGITYCPTCHGKIDKFRKRFLRR